MSQTWVHGNVFVPNVVGGPRLGQVGGIPWSDIVGYKEGHLARFYILDNQKIWFHAPIPVVDAQTLLEVQADFVTASPVLTDVWVHEGMSHVINTNSPYVTSSGGFNHVALGSINAHVTRGICVSLGFSTEAAGINAGEIGLYNAGAIFA